MLAIIMWNVVKRVVILSEAKDLCNLIGAGCLYDLDDRASRSHARNPDSTHQYSNNHRNRCAERNPSPSARSQILTNRICTRFIPATTGSASARSPLAPLFHRLPVYFYPPPDMKQPHRHPILRGRLDREHSRLRSHCCT
jgi:hypothetical protein